MTGGVEKVYSEALFELSNEQNCVDAVNEELTALAKIFNDAPELAKMLCAPTVDSAQKTKFIEQIFKGKTSDITYNFLCLLTDKKRASYLPAIADSFKERFYEMKNIVEVKVTTSVPLNVTLRNKLKSKLEAVYKKTVILEETINPDILGGIVINYGNTMLDGSVKAKLDAMQNQIKNFIA